MVSGPNPNRSDDMWRSQGQGAFAAAEGPGVLCADNSDYRTFSR